MAGFAGWGTGRRSQNQEHRSLCAQVLVRSLLILLKHWVLVVISHPYKLPSLAIVPRIQSFGQMQGHADLVADKVFNCEPVSGPHPASQSTLPRPAPSASREGSSSGAPVLLCPLNMVWGFLPASPSYFPDLRCLPSLFICASLIQPVFYWTCHMV